MMNLLLAAMVFAADPTIDVVSVSELEQRFAAGGDTTFVVNFWATWCKPCIEEMPAFDKLDREHKGTTLKVLMVSLDEKDELATKVKSFIKKKGLLAEVVLLDEPDPNEWIDNVDESWSGAIPATLLVDAASGRRQFHEREFSFTELEQTVEAFMRATK